MKKIIGLLVAVALVSLAGANTLEAQTTCYTCDESDWTNVKCVIASWDGMGGTECNVQWTQCNLGGSPCWGPEPTSAPAHAVRADGRALTVLAGGDIGPELHRAVLRDCNGLLLARSLNPAERRTLEDRAALMRL